MTEKQETKTIFISITRGSAARSYLRSDFLREILNRGNIKVVLLVYVVNKEDVHEYFKKEFDHPMIQIERVYLPSYSKFRRVWAGFFGKLIYSRAEYRHLKYGGIGLRKKNSYPIFLLLHAWYSLIDKLVFLRYVARWAEKNIFKDRAYGDLFEKHKPDLVFCSTIYGTIDVALIKEAYFRGVRTISTPKSWDTVSRMFFRFPSEKMIVANEWMKEIISSEQLYKSSDISVAGLIQFDVYAKKKEYMAKEEFCRKCGLDATKPIVLYAPEGLLTGDDQLYVKELMEDGLFLKKYNLIIRPHFSDAVAGNISEKYEEFRNMDGVYIDDKNLQITGMFHDAWDPTYENQDWQAEVIHASDVVISFMSTMVIDAHILDTPVIAIKYEPVNTTRKVPIALLYTFRHFEAILEEKSLMIAEGKSEVLEYVAKYLEDPTIHENERGNVVKRFAGEMDGLAGKRTAEAVLQHLGEV